jgi:hypothetical protein
MTVMIIAQAIATQLLLIVFPGLVLHRAIADLLLRLDDADSPEGEIPEGDLVIYGLLPGLVIADMVGTVLALLGVFRTEIFAAAMIGLVIWRHREARLTLAALAGHAKAIWQSLARGELMTLVAIGLFARIVFGLVLNAQMPSEIADAWNHQLPLARSIVSHSGFVLPQIDNMFCGTYPIFFNMLFAEGFLFVDDVVAAGIINALLYLGFLLTLIGCARRGRALAMVAIWFLISNVWLLSSQAAEPLTDIPRTCFTVLALVFAWRYLRDRRSYFLFAAGLTAGGAVAGKYTELVTPALIGLSLAPLLLRDRRGLIAAGVLAASFLPVASYPYIRNWVMLGNPVYPFFFAHPGLSDAYMADYLADITRPYDAADRGYVTNLLTLQGWHDFFVVLQERFFTVPRSYAAVLLTVVAAGLNRRNFLGIFLLWSAILAIVWYTVMFNALRWALPFYLTLLSGGFLSFAWFIDQAVSLSNRGGARAVAGLPAFVTPERAMRAASLGLAVAAFALFTFQVVRDGFAGVLPTWVDRRLGEAVLKRGGIEAYLEETRKGYQLYRYIADRDLRMVLQPFDSGASLYQAGYNGGRDGHWILSRDALPGGPDDYASFIARNDVKYFIYVDPALLSPAEVELLGPERLRRTYAFLDTLRPGSRKLLVDPLGWELYAVNAGAESSAAPGASPSGP